MHDYWIEFSKVALAHLLAVASPGPDFAIVLKQSIAHGRRVAIWTAVGVGAAILLHVGYSLLGLGLLIRSSELWFSVVKYAGAAYIAWIGLQSLGAKPLPTGESMDPPVSERGGTERGAFAKGFLTNALNPKATLFFISLFAMIVNPATPKFIQAAYGAWMAVATAAWFSLVAVLFTHRVVRERFLRYGHWIDRTLGIVFLGFAALLVLAKVSSS